MKGFTRVLRRLGALTSTDYSAYLLDTRARLTDVFNKYEEKFVFVRLKRPNPPTLSGKSNCNSLANQLGIHIILAKQEKWAYNSLANQLGKNRNLAKLTSPRAYMHARIVVAIVVSL
jgi:hypothetical protein